jgi:hypothetical protein
MIPVLYALGFSINKGPSMSYLGWVYKTSWGEQPTRVGQIVRFAPPDQPTWRKYLLSSIKRVAEIRKDGYFVEGDNTEQSQDSRDWDKVVPPDHVAGVVNWCWSPARAWRGRTAEGRLANWRELYWGPNAQWSPDGAAVAWVSQTKISVLTREGLCIMSICIMSNSGYAYEGGIEWRNGKMIWPVGVAGDYVAFDLASHQLERFRVTPTRINECGWSDSSHLVVMGDVTKLLRPGDVYHGRRVKAVKYPYLGSVLSVPSGATQSEVVFE